MSHLLVPIDRSVGVRRLNGQELSAYVRSHRLATFDPVDISLADMLVPRATREWVGLVFQCGPQMLPIMRNRIESVQTMRAVLYDSNSRRFTDRGGYAPEQVWFLDIIWKRDVAEPLKDLWAQASMQQWVSEVDDPGPPDLRVPWGLLITDVELFPTIAGHSDYVVSFSD